MEIKIWKEKMKGRKRFRELRERHSRERKTDREQGIIKLRKRWGVEENM